MRLPDPRAAQRPLLLLGLVLGFAACSTAAAPDRPEKVGLTALEFVDTARNRPLAVQLWYPAVPESAEAPQAYEYAFRGHAAPDAAYREGGRRPLVVLSHGDHGSHTNQAWLAEALAGHGYIVASVAHWMNTRTHNTPEATLRAWERPLDASFVIGSLLQDPAWQARIDPARIGAAGHSSGGYTALALAGARYAVLQMQDYCRGAQAGPDCGFARGANIAQVDFRGSGDSYRDVRVRAVAALAPALGPGLTAESLRGIGVPVLIVAARDDEILPFEQHAARDAREIPGAVLEALPGGGHFVFMPECTWTGWVFTFFNAFDICGGRHDVDRAAMHAQVIGKALRFFDAALAAAPQASTPRQ